MSRAPKWTGIGLAAVMGLAACGGETLQQGGPTPAATAEATLPSPAVSAPESAPKATMKREYRLTADAHESTARMQIAVGAAAVDAMLGRGITVRVDKTTYEVRLAVPADTSARDQVVIITADSANSGKVLASNGIPGHETDDKSVTLYFINPKTLLRSGSSVSVVGQETGDFAGLIHNAATEFCQPHDISAQPPIPDTTTYQTLKEGACNTFGAATDSVFLKHSYAEYVKKLEGMTLGKDAANGSTVPYTPVSALDYAVLGGAVQAGINALRPPATS